MLVYLTYVFTVFGHVGPFKNVLENYLPNKEIKKSSRSVFKYENG